MSRDNVSRGTSKAEGENLTTSPVPSVTDTTHSDAVTILPDPQCQRVNAWADGGAHLIGTLTYEEDGFVSHVEVAAAYRRRGIATQMMDSMPMSPSHAPPDCGEHGRR